MILLKVQHGNVLCGQQPHIKMYAAERSMQRRWVWRRKRVGVVVVVVVLVVAVVVVVVVVVVVEEEGKEE